ncbi:unnamed protein product [Prorocentrum cordatum]|uniref:Uncharacterized protein n=1 Tax=Prorocentrum cordatum TaxID=2364126 RepID=A0ABN9UM44_9DINO|nr:unnamed protein product [Polarella glacialis]
MLEAFACSRERGSSVAKACGSSRSDAAISPPKRAPRRFSIRSHRNHLPSREGLRDAVPPHSTAAGPALSCVVRGRKRRNQRRRSEELLAEAAEHRRRRRLASEASEGLQLEGDACGAEVLRLTRELREEARRQSGRCQPEAADAAVAREAWRLEAEVDGAARRAGRLEAALDARRRQHARGRPP